MSPYKHAESSAAKFGGSAEDYADIHDWLDETKQYTGNWTHRALRHHAAGVQWVIERFGHSRVNSAGRPVPVKMIAEQHIEEDCGYIPTVADWLDLLKKTPDDWMLKVATTTTTKLTTKQSQ